MTYALSSSLALALVASTAVYAVAQAPNVDVPPKAAAPAMDHSKMD